MTLDEAKAASVKLEPGMSRQNVATLFGLPKKTEVLPMGSETKNPWNGLVWRYEWWIDHPADCSAGAFCRGRAAQFELVFQRAEQATPDGDTWLLNSWSWHGE